MKNLRTLLFTLAMTMLFTTVSAQDYTGMWLGTLTVTEQMKLQVGFDISKNDDGSFSAKMNVIEQKAFDLPMDVCKIDDNKLHLEMKSLGITYDGTFNLKEKTVDGTFFQGAKFDLDLAWVEELPKVMKKKQLPKAPFPYNVEEVEFENKEEGFSLAGTLTMPKEGKKFPAVLLISGSGPNDRDETEYGHFLLLADNLTRNGFAVLRYDKRGVEMSGGEYETATTYDFAKDALAGLQYLKSRKDIDKKTISLIGHSEGAAIAAILAAENKKDIHSVILLGGMGVTGNEILLEQTATITRLYGANEMAVSMAVARNKAYNEAVMEGGTEEEISERLKTVDPNINEQAIKTLISPWYQSYLTLDPIPYLEEISCPVLALTGEKDSQCSPDQNLPPMEKALKKNGNNEVTVRELTDLNHLFQRAETGSPMEYDQLEDIIAPSVLHQIVKWLKE